MRCFRTQAIPLIALVAISGCAANSGSERQSYRDLPGSGDHMAEGPGLFGSNENRNEDGGYRLFSNDADKSALFNSSRTQPQQHAVPASSAVPTTGPGNTNTAAAPDAASPEPAPDQQASFQKFKEYEQFRKFEQVPRNSAEYQKFRDWQEWKRYQRWKNNNSGQR